MTGRFPNAYAADQCSISLPLFHGMKEEEQNFVIEKVWNIKANVWNCWSGKF